MLFPSRVAMLTAAPLLILSALGMAQDTTSVRPDTTRPVELSPIVVSATRTPRTVQDLPVSTSVVRGDEVRATPALTLDDALRTVPGLNVPFESAVTAHYTSNGVSVRGIGGYVTALVLLDGIPLNDPMSGYIPWAKVPAELVDRVEVVRGGSSSLYGTYALGGVVNIITRRPAANEFGAGVSYGSNNTIRTNALGSIGLSPAVRLTLNGSFYDTDGYVRPIPSARGPLDERGWSRAGNGLAQLDIRLSEQSSAFLRANYYDFYGNQGSPLAFDGQREFDLAGEIQDRSPTGRTISATGFFERDVPRTYNTDPITARGVDEFLSNFHRTPATSVGGSFLWSKVSSNAKANVTLGLDGHVVNGEDQSDVYSAPDTFAYHETGGGTQLTGGTYAQLEYFVTPALELLGSVRLDAWQNHNGHDNKAPGGVQTFPDKTRASVNPKVAIRYHVGSELTLRGAVYRAFNAPNLDELYRPYSAASYANVPNPRLGPETLVGGEAGVEYAAGPASAQVNVFQNSLTDVISYNPIAFSPVYTTQPVNVGSVRTRGLELFGNWDLRSGWRLSASYTYTQSIVTDNPPDRSIEGNTQGDTPKHLAAASIGHFGGRWSGLVQGRYIGKRPVDISNTRSIDSYFVTDVSGSVQVAPQFEVFGQVQNVFDKLYVVSEYGFDARGAPRQVFAGIRTRFVGGGR
jgi:outer membrane receptor protein involved in Fe transport